MGERLSHTEMCRLFNAPEFQPAPDWKPYAVTRTRIEVWLEGREHTLKWGGAHECSRCGFGISIQPPGDSCPRCGAGSILPRVFNWSESPESDSFHD